MATVSQIERRHRCSFPPAGKKHDTCWPIHYSRHKNNQRRRKQVSAVAQQVLIMEWQVFVPR